MPNRGPDPEYMFSEAEMHQMQIEKQKVQQQLANAMQSLHVAHAENTMLKADIIKLQGRIVALEARIGVLQKVAKDQIEQFPIKPGYGLQCKKCRFWDERAWHNGHSAPCDIVDWGEVNGHIRRIFPQLSDDGRECEDYHPGKDSL